MQEKKENPKPWEMTTKEAIDFLFPEEVQKHLKDAILEADKKKEKVKVPVKSSSHR
jgi:hypothetical protein